MSDRRATDRRSMRLAFRVPERRTGFDRRRSSSAIRWYRDHPGAIAAVLLGVLTLNLLDWILTLRALGRGAREANPVMAALLSRSTALAGGTKIALSLAVVAVLWRMRRYRRILQASLVALAGFTAVLTYQVAIVIAGP